MWLDPMAKAILQWATATQPLIRSRRHAIRYRLSNGMYCWYCLGTELR